MTPSIGAKNNLRQSKIIKTKRVRAKTALPSVRGHYHNYTDAKIDWLTRFNLLEKCKSNKKEMISEYNIGINMILLCDVIINGLKRENNKNKQILNEQ